MNRGLIATKSTNWVVVLSGFVEPIFYLLSLGVGLGGFIGTVTDAAGNEIPYAAYIAPALLAVSAMNGAIYDSTWNVFFKMNFGKLYHGMLATSLGPLDVALGEILLALLRGGVYGLGFLIIMQGLGLNLALDRAARAPRHPDHRVRLRQRRDGDHQLPEDVPADGVDPVRAAADVPVLGDVLPAHRCTRSRSSGSCRRCRSGTRSSWCAG